MLAIGGQAKRLAKGLSMGGLTRGSESCSAPPRSPHRDDQQGVANGTTDLFRRSSSPPRLYSPPWSSWTPRSMQR
ncbi:unnamed protein product [Lota lota]